MIDEAEEARLKLIAYQRFKKEEQELLKKDQEELKFLKKKLEDHLKELPN